MLPIVGIIAPLNSKTFYGDFVLKTENKIELTFNKLSAIFQSNFNSTKNISSNITVQKDAAAAGYYLSGLLKKNRYDTIISSSYDIESLLEIERLHPIAICLSTSLISEFESLKKVVKSIRMVMPEKPLIVGGMLVWKSYLWYKLLKDNGDMQSNNIDNKWYIFPTNKSEIDVDVFVVSNHGGEILLHVLKEIQRSNKIAFLNIPNVAIPINNKKYEFTHRVDENVDYNSDIIQWDLLDKLPSRIPIRTSIGCSFQCNFCDFCHLYPKLVIRSKQSLLKELSLLKSAIKKSKQPILNLFLTDDNVFINQNQIEIVCNSIIESNINKPWAGFIRGDNILSSNIDFIKKSGLSFGIIGVESGDQDQLNRMEKKTKIEAVKKGIELMDKAGIPVLMTFVVGFPGENNRSIDQTIKFINELEQTSGLLSYQLYPFMVTPLSHISSNKLRGMWGLEGMGHEWKHNTMNSKNVDNFLLYMFKKISSVSYHYSNESYYFLKQFSIETILQMVMLRNELTIDIIEKKHKEVVKKELIAIGRLLGYCNKIPTDGFIQSLNL